MKVGIIDSGFNPILEDNSSVECLKYSKKFGFRTALEKVENEHGTEIAHILQREAPECIEILSLQVLGENNKCTLQALLDAIDYCMERKVDIINMSLGYTGMDSVKIDMLRERCREANRRGIAIVAAFTNEENIVSYPAAFPEVISVSSKKVKNLFMINMHTKGIIFSEDFVYTHIGKRNVVRRGNSYLCPIITGWLCKFLESNQLIDNRQEQFLQFLLRLQQDNSLSRIFVDRLSNEEDTIMQGAKNCFFGSMEERSNQAIFQYYKKLNYDIEYGYDALNNISFKHVREYVRKFEVFYIGLLDVNYYSRKESFIKMLITVLMEERITVISVYPLFRSYERMDMVEKYQSDFKVIYK